MVKTACGWYSDDDTLGEVWLVNHYACSLNILNMASSLFALLVEQEPSSWQGNHNHGSDAGCSGIYSWSLLLHYLCESITLWAQLSSTVIAAAVAIGLGKTLTTLLDQSTPTVSAILCFISLSKT